MITTQPAFVKKDSRIFDVLAIVIILLFTTLLFFSYGAPRIEQALTKSVSQQNITADIAE